MKKEAEGVLPKTFNEVTITLTQIHIKTGKKENYRSMSLINIYLKMLNTMLTNILQIYMIRFSTMSKLALFLKFRDGSSNARCNKPDKHPKGQKTIDRLNKYRKSIL